MIHKTTALTVRKNLGELLNGVQYRHDTVLITKAGKPVAALVGIDIFEKIVSMKAYFERLTNELGEAYQGVDPKIANTEINEAVKAVRAKKTKKTRK